MNCEKCNAPMTARTVEKYQYKESGLDNVYLMNMDAFVCEKCGSTEVLIPRIKLLHATLARAIALQPNPLTGPEIRFLRKQLRLRAKEFAVYLQVDASTLSRWENDSQPRNNQNDSLIRYVFFRLLEEREGQMTSGPVAEQIAATDYSNRRRSEVCINANNPAVFSYC